MIGRTIGNYRIVAELGAGGMGQVYRAHDAKLNRNVAIKVVPDVFAGDAERLGRFEREARLLATLNHANIGAVYGLEESDGKRFLIMELVEGEDLSARTARGPIPVDDACDIALQIASALEAAHEQGVIHRDLKPANIRITDDGRVKVLDFGLAKALDPVEGSSPTALTQSPTAFMSSPTVAGVILGTAAYMSPEQARGKRVDKRTDVFAFGIVFYEMLTGRTLFAGDTVSDTLAAVLRETPDLNALPANTPRAVKQVIARCLEKDPRRRLRDIGEARILLEDVRSGVVRDEASPVAPAARRRNPLVAYGGWLAAGLVMAIMITLMMRSNVETDSSLPLRRAAMTLSQDDASFRYFFMPAISPDGRFVVYARNDELWLRDLTQLHARAIPGTKGGRSPFWSYDGAQIGFGRETSLLRVSRDGGEPVLIATMPLGMTVEGTGCGAWDANDRIVIGPSSAGLQSVSARGGQVTEWIKPAANESDFHELCMLPGNHGFVAVLHNSAGIGNLELVRPDGSRKALMHVEENLVSPTYSPSGHLVFERRGATRGIWAIQYDLKQEATVGDPFVVISGGRSPSVSRDGTLCYVDNVTEPLTQLVWLDRTGAVVGRLDPPDLTYRPFPAISPDGRTVALANQFATSTRELFLYDLGTGARRRLSFTDYGEEIPFWHPNGVDVLTYRWSPPTMYIYPTSSGAQPRFLGSGIMPAISPDGSTLVYAVQHPGEWNYDIMARPVDGDSTEARALISTPSVDWAPSFSPDGKFLLFVSGSSGRDEVYVTTFPEPSTLWQISSNGGNFPHWSADNRTIYFTTTNEIWSADVMPGDRSLVVGTPKFVCNRPSTNWSGRWPDGFDVTADGRRFLVLEPVTTPSDTPPAIVTVQNWFEEFRAK
jgi:Tol biopolymer transport system component